MPKSTDAMVLKQINDLGEKIAPMLDGYPALVVLNAMGALFVGAVRARGLHAADAHDALDLIWNDGGGLSAEVVRAS